MSEDVSLLTVWVAPMPEDVRWGPTPGFTMEVGHHEGILEYVSALPVEEAHFRFVVDPAVGGQSFMLILGRMDSTEPPYGILCPFFEDDGQDLSAYTEITERVMADPKKRWTLGASSRGRVLFWYLEDAKVVAKAIWKTHAKLGDAELVEMVEMPRPH
jgi:hypothetical protein